MAHLTAAEYLEFNYLDTEEFSEFFKFAFVRNPYERLLSEFRFNWRDRGYTFRDFVLGHFPVKDSYCDLYRHVMPQAEFLYDASGTLMVDFVGRFENFSTDFKRVCAIVGLPQCRPPHLNSTNTSTNTRLDEEYDDEVSAFVRDKYAQDFFMFGYDPELRGRTKQ